MASTVSVAFTHTQRVSDGTAALEKAPRVSEELTSSATSQQTTATAREGEVAYVTSVGGNIYAMAGSDPTVAATNGYLIPDGTSRPIGPLTSGDEVAIIDM